MQQSKSKMKKLDRNNHGTKKTGVVRIIGGNMRGRKLHFATVSGLRPTLDRIRETLFNWLARDIVESQCLDLFSGSGALGFEAVSRGAMDVTLVEASAKVSRDLKSNIENLSINNAKVVNMEAARFLSLNKKKFDLVFLDPPFGKGLLGEVFDDLKPHLAPDAIVYVEQEISSGSFEPGADWEQLKYKKTGSFSYALYSQSGSNNQTESD